MHNNIRGHRNANVCKQTYMPAVYQRKFQTQTVMPGDILVFLAQQWFPNHAGSAISSAELIAAPNSLATIKSQLSRGA